MHGVLEVGQRAHHVVEHQVDYKSATPQSSVLEVGQSARLHRLAAVARTTGHGHWIHTKRPAATRTDSNCCSKRPAATRTDSNCCSTRIYDDPYTAILKTAIVLGMPMQPQIWAIMNTTGLYCVTRQEHTTHASHAIVSNDLLALYAAARAALSTRNRR